MSINEMEKAAPRDILCRYQSCLARLAESVSMVQSVEITIDEFRECTGKTFFDFKGLTIEMVVNGHISLLSEVGLLKKIS